MARAGRPREGKVTHVGGLKKLIIFYRYRIRDVVYDTDLLCNNNNFIPTRYKLQC